MKPRSKNEPKTVPEAFYPPLEQREHTEPSAPPLAGGAYKDGVQVEKLDEE